jgi:peroxiredoxin
LDAVSLRGRETVGGEACDVLELSIMDGQRTRVLWLSANDHLPRKVSQTILVANTLTMEEIWSDVAINAEMPSEQFVWQPPENWREWRFPASEDKLLKPGSEAPEFCLPVLGGGEIRLSDLRGKVVWLAFWRIGCPPCREEIPYLEQLYRRLAPKGLAVLGIDVSDDESALRQFLSDNEVTFPNVLDTSAEARELAWEQYGPSAVPVNYVIDANGVVIDGWLGYGEGDKRGEGALAKAGIQ